MEITETKVPLTPDEYFTAIDMPPTQTQVRAYEEGTWQPYRLVATVEYDAPNAFGTMVRATSVCEYTSVRGDPDDIIAGAVRVDGMTSSQRLLELAP